jgi:mycothiol S-conjugate amidase
VSLCLLTVHAHPDDEASKGAPTVAKAVAEGIHTVLVCATGGEMGDVHNPALLAEGGSLHGLTPDQIAERLPLLRAEELAAATTAIGFHEVVMLGYRDSGMKDDAANEHPESFHMADLDESVGRLVATIRRTRPQVILTYNDDQAGYPHPDHVKVHDISVLAYDRAGDPAWYPEAGEPWQPLKLYFTVWARDRMVSVRDRLVHTGRPNPFDDAWFERPSQDHRITTKVDVGPWLPARRAALLAHATQVDPTEPFWFPLSDEELAEVYPWEDWILARSEVGFPAAGVMEADLFERVPTPGAAQEDRRVA